MNVNVGFISCDFADFGFQTFSRRNEIAPIDYYYMKH